MPNPAAQAPTPDDVIQGLQAWIHKAVDKVEEKLAKRKKRKGEDLSNDDFPPLRLAWADPEGQEKPVHEYEREDLKALGSPVQIAQTIYQRASEDAAALGDKQAYFVTIEGYAGRFPLVFEEDDLDEDDDLGGAGGEGDDEDDEELGDGTSRFGRGGSFGGGGYSGSGITPGRIPNFELVEWSKVRTSHEQALMRQNFQLVQEFMRNSRHVIQDLSETVRNQDKQHVNLRVALEEMLDTKHQRDLEMKRITHAEERKERAIGMIEPFAMSIAARLLGPAAAQGENGQTLYKLLNSVFSSFSEEQLMGLVNEGKVQLSTEQRAHLIELFRTMKGLEAAPQGRPNGATSDSASANGAQHVNGESK